MQRMHFLLALTVAAFFLPAITSAQPIFRCGNAYSQEACKGGKLVEDKTTTLHSRHSGSTVYLCKGHGGGLFWSSHSCGQHNAFLERTETVPSGLPWDQKVAQAEALWRKTQSNTSASTAVYNNRPAQTAEPGKKSLRGIRRVHQNSKQHGACEQSVLRLELGARGLTAARDQRFSINC